MWRMVAALAAQIAVAAVAAPSGAAESDELVVPAGLVPMALAGISPGAALSAEASTAATIFGSPVTLVGGATGDIAGLTSEAGGFVTGTQLSTGFNNIQQNAISVVVLLGGPQP